MTTPLAQLQHMLDPLAPVLEGGTEDIAINEPGQAYVRRTGAWTRHELPSLDYDAMLDMTIFAASLTHQRTGSRHPLLFTDIPMRDAAPLRLMAFTYPAVEPGKVAWTLRQPGSAIHSISEVANRYKRDRWNKWERRKEMRDHGPMLDLFDKGDEIGFLEQLVKRKYNILLCGATGSGKTTFGITLIDAIPLEERIVTIENAREYRLRHPNKLHLLYAQGQGEAQVTQRDLQLASLRARPDRVLVQELLDSEAASTYVDEIVSGHPGSITTIHGRDAAQAFKRLFNLVKSSVSGASQDDATVVTTLGSAIDCIIPFHNEGSEFEMREVWFAPERERAGDWIGTLLSRDA